MNIMSNTQKVAVITGASQGIGAALVPAYRKLGYAVVANSRSITPSDDPGALTKGGLNAVTKSLAIEYADRGIRANTVSLGIIRTPMHPEETHDFLAALHPLRRMGDIDDVVDAVLYLENAGFVTGESLHVDGGQSAGH